MARRRGGTGIRTRLKIVVLQVRFLPVALWGGMHPSAPTRPVHGPTVDGYLVRNEFDSHPLRLLFAS